MNNDDLLKNWGNQLNQLLKQPVGEQSSSRIKQKDLAQALGIRESNITEWKKGNWDIHLTNIYAIVEYVKKVYPNSTPMLTLFSDLLDDEIEKVKQSVVADYEKKISVLTEKLNDEMNKEAIETYNELDSYYNELQDKYDKLKRDKEDLEFDLKEIRFTFKRLPPKVKMYLRDRVSKIYHSMLGIKE